MARTLGTAGKLRSGICGSSKSGGGGGRLGLGGTDPIMHCGTQCLALLEGQPSLIPPILILSPSSVPTMC